MSHFMILVFAAKVDDEIKMLISAWIDNPMKFKSEDYARLFDYMMDIDPDNNSELDNAKKFV